MLANSQPVCSCASCLLIGCFHFLRGVIFLLQHKMVAKHFLFFIPVAYSSLHIKILNSFKLLYIWLTLSSLCIWKDSVLNLCVVEFSTEHLNGGTTKTFSDLNLSLHFFLRSSGFCKGSFNNKRSVLFKQVSDKEMVLQGFFNSSSSSQGIFAT